MLTHEICTWDLEIGSAAMGFENSKLLDLYAGTPLVRDVKPKRCQGHRVATMATPNGQLRRDPDWRRCAAAKPLVDVGDV